MIAVVDYGMGNLRSVLNALDRLGVDNRLAPTPAELEDADKLILPGVGAFGDGMRGLEERGLAEALAERVAAGRPLLGICLGMQLLATRGTEHGEHAGLGLIGGSVERIVREDLRVPHVGWNTLAVTGDSAVLAGLDPDPTFYYVHSFEFRADAPEAVIGTTDYGGPVTACVQSGHVIGVQFHPEKSQRDGLKLLQSFVAL